MKNQRNYSKRVLFTIMGLMSLLVFGYEVFYFITDAGSRTRLLSMKWLLFPHILFATTAFLVGPIQFSSRLRNRNLTLHRALGKLYVFSVLLAAPFAIAISCVYPPNNKHFLFENIVQGAIWFLTTVIAWLAAQNRQLVLHKAWAARSYSVTFIFVLSRVFSPLPFFRQMSIESAIDFFWFLLIFSLLVPELFINGKVLLLRQRKRSSPDSYIQEAIAP